MHDPEREGLRRGLRLGGRAALGQQIAAVGNSGSSDGPHLHFEIWLDGWYASKASHPIDPLPDLLAWAG